MTLKQKKAARTVVATGVAKTVVVIKKTLWYTVVIPIIVLNLVAVYIDMITLAVNIAKHIMSITIMTESSRIAYVKTKPQSSIALRLRSFYKVVYINYFLSSFDGILHCLVSTTGFLFYIAD